MTRLVVDEENKFICNIEEVTWVKDMSTFKFLDKTFQLLSINYLERTPADVIITYNVKEYNVNN